MEKEGLVRALAFLKRQGLTVGVLVTDRHQQIAKFVRENHTEITHYYDVWHLAKGKICFLTLSSATFTSSLVVMLYLYL